MKKEQIENLLKREMSRKEFLGAIGLGVASVAGMGAVMRLFFNNKTSKSAAQTGGNVMGYGGSTYGGLKNS